MSRILSDKKIVQAYSRGVQCWMDNPPPEQGTDIDFDELRKTARREIALEQRRTDIRWLREPYPYKMVTAPYRRRWDCGACRWEFERGV